MSTALTIRRLRDTPLYDLLRGRVTARLDWRGRIQSAALPAPAAGLILRVTRHTRLWRGERTDVADELVAHFSDGLASGNSLSDLIRDFGDERAAAKLIRRAKLRNRSRAWHAMKYATRGLMLLLLCYALLVIRFASAKPTPSVNYLPALNAATDRVPPEQQAWPLYREAVGVLNEASNELNTPLAVQEPDSPYTRTLVEATPSDAEWPQLGAWLDAHTAEFAKLRAAAERPSVGFRYELVDDGTYAHQLWLRPAWGDRSRPALPDVNTLMSARRWLEIDLLWAIDRRDGARAAADIHAMLGMAVQQRGNGEIFMQRAAANDARSTLRLFQDALRDDATLFDDRQLTNLAHTVAVAFDGETAGAFYDFEVARKVAYDRVQRIYTSDGKGDGRLSPAALPSSFAPDSTVARDEHRLRILAGALLATTASRATAEREIDRLIATAKSRLARPAHEFTAPEDWRPLESRPQAAPRSALLMLATIIRSGRNDPTLKIDLQALHRAGEFLIATRDATLTAIALELHRRRHGDYPQALDDMVPALPPRVPIDRITGGAVRYRRIDGKPVVYSLGVDHDDDGGRTGRWRDGQPTHEAARWTQRTGKDGPVDGDWILYEGGPYRSEQTIPPATQPSGH